MRAGRLRSRVSIQKQTNRKDELGQDINEWMDIFSVKAEIRDVTGKEFFSSQTEQSQTDCKILIRYRMGITTDMRVAYRGVYYDIKAIISDVKNTQLELLCEKVKIYD